MASVPACRRQPGPGKSAARTSATRTDMCKPLPWVLLMLLSPLSVAQAEVQTKEVTYTHEGVTFKGVLAWDDSVQGKRPGVLVVHEWWGLNDYARDRAKQLAKLGYVAFACDMYGE